jgi:uncharacterized protein (TIGR02996 family)
MTSPAEAQLLQALAAAPEDELAWQGLADVRQEQGDPSGSLLRLRLGVRQQWQDPPGPPEGSARVIRGGSWLNHGLHCRSANRSGYVPSFRYYFLGFRVALVLSGE